MWRHKGWKTPYDPIVRVKEYLAFEAGADAMLEALKEEGEHLPEGFRVIYFPTVMPAGRFIFIPDEDSNANR